MIYLKKNVKLILGIFLIIGLFALLYKIYIPRVNAFGCFDDCFNYMGGYFLLKGESIYSDFFYNHQPGMAYLSAIVQNLFNPSSIPELILRHRQFILLFSIISTILLFLRFRYPILLMSLLYEPFKFYVFGDRFLAESIVGYLIVYMIGVCLLAIRGNFKKYDFFIIPLVSSSVIMLREPFIPISLLLLGTYIFYVHKNNKEKIIKLLFMFALPLTVVFTYKFSDYFLNLVTVNKLVLASEPGGINFIFEYLKSFFYPIYIIFAPLPFPFSRLILILASLFFISSLLINSLKNSALKTTIFVLIVLSLINLRPVSPDKPFYEAFHIAPWFLTVSFLSSYFMFEIFNSSKKLFSAISIIIAIFLIFLFFNKEYFPNQNVNTNDEYFTNYSHVMDIGTTIRNLSDKDDTLFVDGYDDLIIWEAKLNSPYKYGWYTSYMPKVPLYKNERDSMLVHFPPDFYYGQCLESLKNQTDPVSLFLASKYAQLSPENEKSCLLINKAKLENLNEEKFQKLKGTKYEGFKNPATQQ